MEFLSRFDPILPCESDARHEVKVCNGLTLPPSECQAELEVKVGRWSVFELAPFAEIVALRAGVTKVPGSDDVDAPPSGYPATSARTYPNLAAFMDANYGHLQERAVKMCGGQVAGEDVLHDTLLYFLGNTVRFVEDAYWMWKRFIWKMKRQYRSWLRKNRRVRSLGEEVARGTADPDEFLACPGTISHAKLMRFLCRGSGREGQDAVFRACAIEWLSEAIAKLTRKQQDFLCIHLSSGCRLRRTARAMGIAYNVAKQRFHRIIQKLKQVWMYFKRMFRRRFDRNRRQQLSSSSMNRLTFVYTRGVRREHRGWMEQFRSSPDAVMIKAHHSEPFSRN